MNKTLSGLARAGLCAACLSCGQGNERTCFAVSVSYHGNHTASPSYLHLSSQSDGSLDVARFGATITALQAGNGYDMCFERSSNQGKALTVTTAWIDVTGTETAQCTPLASATCQPKPGDPVGHSSAELRLGETSTVSVEIVDPP